jgi:hypothetical protein
VIRWKAGDDAAQFNLDRSRWLIELRSELLRSVREMRAATLRPRIDSHGVLENALRPLAVSLLRQDKPITRGAKAKRMVAALDPGYLLRLLKSATF